jgi:3',5'-cyclic AMP phosphodiesterase CpdA
MRLAHISDLHILDLYGVDWRRFLNRRVLGGMNVLVNRAREFRPEILEIAVEDILREGVDHVVVSGDLSNLAFEPEFDRVFHLLSLLGGYERVSVVPGNHDYYTARAADTRRFEKVFYPFMFRGEFSDLDVDIYPYRKRIGELLLLGVNSATRTLVPFSYGTLGQRQLDLLDRTLESAERSNLLTCVVMHHCLHRRDLVAEMSSGLLNRDRFLELALRQRVDLVLYGHDHRGLVWKKEQDGHALTLCCCGSTTRLSEDPRLVAKYRIVTIEQRRVRKLETKVYDPATRRFAYES